MTYSDGSVAYNAALDELEEHYGDAEIVVSAFIEKALNWPLIKASNPKALYEFGMLLAECLNAVKSLEAIKVLEYSENMRQLVGKFPYHL